MPRQELVKFSFSGGYASDVPATMPGNHLRKGSKNLLPTAAGLIVPFKGLTQLSDLSPSRQFFLTDDSYAGLGDFDTPGSGSVFKCLDLLFFIGSGPLQVGGDAVIDGTMLQVDASSQLRYIKRDGGTFLNADDDHMFDVGHARPSAPTLYAKTPVSAGQKPMNAVVAIVIWRADSDTGQPSLPSESTTVTLTNGSIIVQFPEADTNNQTVWGVAGTLLGIQLGNLYQIPTSRNGEVLESTLAFSRSVTAKANVTLGDKTITLDPSTVLADRFTAADIGRRVEIAGSMDSWIVSITDAFNAEANDDATANAVNQNITITHAVDGYTRAIELSYSDDDLLQTQTPAPFDAFEPMDGRFAGFMLDTFFIEDLEGTIFYSIPNFLSFPRKYRKIYTEDKATVYIDTGRGFQWRIAPQSISQLTYFPGEAPIQLAIKAKNIGCKFPCNACLGYGGRLIVWAGRPTIVDVDGSIRGDFHYLIESEIESWVDQTVTEPVVVAYDDQGKYEIWAKGDTIFAYHAISNTWSAPIIVSDFFEGTCVVMGSVIINEKLHLIIDIDSDLFYCVWNEGSGSDIRAVTYARQLPAKTVVTEAQTVVRRGDTQQSLDITGVLDFDRDLSYGTAVIPAESGDILHHCATSMRPNHRGGTVVHIQLDCVGADGKFGIEYVNLFGEWTGTFSDPAQL